MKGLCAVISGGSFSPLDGIENADFIIVCDRGYDYARKNNIDFDLFVGDFDSCSEKPRDSSKILSLPKEKDDTDTMAAIRHALSLGFSEIVLYCALGGRLDHTYANLQSAAFAAERGAKVYIHSDECEVYVINGGCLEVPLKRGFSLSVFSLSDSCEGVYETGVKYPLSDAVVKNTFPIGVSNEWTEDTAKISVRRGILAVILSEK